MKDLPVKYTNSTLSSGSLIENIIKFATEAETGSRIDSYWCSGGHAFIKTNDHAKLLYAKQLSIPQISTSRLYVYDKRGNVVQLRTIDESALPDLSETPAGFTIGVSAAWWSLVYDSPDECVLKPNWSGNTRHFLIRKRPKETGGIAWSNKPYSITSYAINHPFMQMIALKNYDASKSVAENFNQFAISTSHERPQIMDARDSWGLHVSPRAVYTYNTSDYAMIGFGLCYTVNGENQAYTYGTRPIDTSTTEIYTEYSNAMVEINDKMIKGMFVNNASNTIARSMGVYPSGSGDAVEWALFDAVCYRGAANNGSAVMIDGDSYILDYYKIAMKK